MLAPTGHSYFPLLSLQSRPGDAFSPSLQRLSGDDTYSPHPTASEGSSNFSPLCWQLSSRGQSACCRPHLWRIIKTPLQMALLPLVAIGYLAFCYAVHGKVVPVNTFGLYGVTQQHFAVIKGSITSINIIIISIALYPIYDVISSLKSEEFFRVLESHNQGVQLEMINHISTLSFGNVDMLAAIWNRMCSNYCILSIVTSFLVWVIATLAPGALTVSSVLADGELMAFAIGAVLPRSVFNGASFSGANFPGALGPAYNSSANSVRAALIAWGEIELGIQYSFGTTSASESGYAAYIAPVPLNLSMLANARWLSDVIGINPTCSWASTNLTSPVQLSSNFDAVTAYLPDFNLDVRISSDDTSIGIGSTALPTDASFPNATAFAIVKDPTQVVTNHTTHVPPSDGSTVFLLGQCQSGCSNVLNNTALDMTGINTIFTISFTDQTWNLAILACVPNITIETREMRSNGHGILIVQPPPAGSRLKHQDNLNPVQTNAMFSIATRSLTYNAGPLSGLRTHYNQLGSQVQGDLLFGREQFESLPLGNGLTIPQVTVTLASIEDITKGYTRIIQSAAKAYLGGYLGTTYVPGRIATSEIVFAASIPNLAISSAVFALLFAIIIITHFRQDKGMGFTLVNFAAAVYGSELPAQIAESTGGGVDCEQVADVDTGAGATAAEDLGRIDGQLLPKDASGGHSDVMEMWGKRLVVMQRRVDGSPVLHLGP